MWLAPWGSAEVVRTAIPSSILVSKSKLGITKRVPIGWPPEKKVTVPVGGSPNGELPISTVAVRLTGLPDCALPTFGCTEIAVGAWVMAISAGEDRLGRKPASPL